MEGQYVCVDLSEAGEAADPAGSVGRGNICANELS